MAEPSWNRVVDVLVVGSGAAALTAAVVAADGDCEVEILETSDKIGGTSAFSGGMPWVPLNSHMAEADVTDSREEALIYLRGITKGRAPDDALLEVYVDHAAEAFEYIEGHTALRFQPSRRFSDYFADKPGGKPRARSMDTVPFNSREQLGEWADRVRETPHFPMGLTQDELAGAGSAPDPRNVHMGEGGGASVDLMAVMAQRQEAGITSLGMAMIGGLLRGVLDREIAISLDTRAKRLVKQDGEVVGVVAEHDGDEVRIGARRGVVLACGGFEWNHKLVRAFLGVPEVRPLSPPSNVGDGLIMALEAGAMLANMSVAWAFPVGYDGQSTYEGEPLAILATPRQEPGCITVNQSGRRFVNEGVTYMDFPRMHRAYDPTTQTYPNESPVWMIFDQRVRDRIHIADLHPGDPTPSWVKEAPTVAALATQIGIDPNVLSPEVERFNGYVDDGVDPDFGRGTVWWEGWTTGGPSPEKSMARVDQAPFYAMPLYDGILGTAGGLLVDENGRVRAARGGVVPGLYAAGNVAASIFGPSYPGGGSTLGPAMTFGYLAGRHLGTQAERRSVDGRAAALAIER
jgi:succinate dehydrogenase/fumarate reductase flavoprotein subunit